VNQAPTLDLDSTPTEEQVDPELLDLPAPPKRERSMVVGLLLVTALASLAMIFALRRDAAYAFSVRDAAEIGDFGTAAPDLFAENEFVHGTAMLGAAHAIRYERPLQSGSYRLMPVAGRPNVWAEVKVPAGAENVRWVPPSAVSGRLVKFDAAGPRHRGLADAVKDATGTDVPKNAWLLVDGDAPTDARYAVLLCMMFFGFAVWNLTMTAKLLRKVKSD
jgi:hypothetical protein